MADVKINRIRRIYRELEKLCFEMRTDRVDTQKTEFDAAEDRTMEAALKEMEKAKNGQEYDDTVLCDVQYTAERAAYCAGFASAIQLFAPNGLKIQ